MSNALKALINWTCWLFIPALLAFIMSLIFSFSYTNAVHSEGFITLMIIYSIFMTIFFCISLDEDSKPMSFIK